MESAEAISEPQGTTPDSAAPTARTAAPAVHPDWADRAETLSWWLKFKINVVRSFLLGFARVFGLSGLYRFGAFFGACEYLVSLSRRKRVNIRIDRIFPEGVPPQKRREILRRYFRRTRCDKMFYTILDGLRRDEILARLHFPTRAILDDAMAGGKGTYVAMSHYGSLHVGGVIMTLLGYKMAGVRDRNEGALRRYMQHKLAESLPEFAAYRMFFADAFPREIMRCFHHQFVVASALDIDTDRVQATKLRTCPVRLFGEERNFLTGPIQMALRCHAPVIQGFVISRPNFHYEFVASGPLIDPATESDSPEAIAAAMQAYADGITAHVREYPCHLMKI